MNTRIFVSLAAALAASGAFAQTPAQSFVDEPIASSLVTAGADQAKLDAIAQALNADASLKNSKIVVQAENGTIVLTGAALSQDQAEHARQIAAAQAGGDDKVVNVIQPDRVTKYRTWEQIG